MINQSRTSRDPQPGFRASLETLFSQGFFGFPREISSFSLGKLEIPWKNSVAKLALNVVKGYTTFSF
jgi:hypothetical protein